MKNKATSIIKFQQIFSSLYLKDIGIHSRDGAFDFNVGKVNLHSTKGTHWVVYINESFFDSYGCPPPQKLTTFILKRNGHCLYSEYKIQGLISERDSYCASCCLYIIYLTKVIGIDFESAVLNLHNQRFSLSKWDYGK